MRDFEGNPKFVTTKINPECQWVIEGYGCPTRKWNGTACMIKNKKLYKRYDAKQGKPLPKGFIPAQSSDPVTGHYPGWVAVTDGPEDKWHREAFNNLTPTEMIDGTYELLGPMIQGNPEDFEAHVLIPHGRYMVEAPRSYEELKEWLRYEEIEGVVWHNSDGRMAKIKKSDFLYETQLLTKKEAGHGKGWDYERVVPQKSAGSVVVTCGGHY